MFCPVCESEYREGFIKCSDCDVLLVHDLDADDENVPASLKGLAHEGSPELIADLLDRLERAGIPYVIQAGTALAVFEGERPTADRPLEWEARVWIIDTFEQEAQRILGELRAERAQEVVQTIVPRGLDRV
jgi:hypothetical protein